MSEQPPPNPFDPPQPYGQQPPPPPGYGQQPPPAYGAPPAYGPPAGYGPPPAYGPPDAFAPTGYAPQSFAPPKTGNGFAVAALVVSIVGLVGSWIPFFGLVLPLVAIGLGIAGIVRSRRVGSGKAMAISGLVVALVALVIATAISIYSLRFVDCFKPGTTTIEQQNCIDDKVRNG